MSLDMTLTPPDGCGRRLIQHIIDERATSNHSRPYLSIPLTSNPSDGYRDISYRTIANAINRLARWILEEMGPPAPDRPNETIVYLGSGDMKYHLMVMAAVKAGYIAFVPSPRNSQEAFDSLMNQCNAAKLVVEEKPAPATRLIESGRALQKFTIPSLQTLLDPTPVPHIPFDKSWEESRFAPFVQIHSSGSTGTPKLITLRHGGFTAVDAFQLLDTNEMGDRLTYQRVCLAFPMFHVAGLITGLACPSFCDCTAVLAPQVPMTADVVNEIHVQGRVTITSLPPSIITDLVKNPVYLENLCNLRGVQYAGGPLNEEVAKQIAPRTKLTSTYGASEWMNTAALTKDPADWQWLRPNIHQTGWEFRARGEGQYEMCITRNPEWEIAQPVFMNFPELDEFCSKDLFIPHPSKPGYWKYSSRMDDIIVFSNGEKLNPVTLEGLISTSTDVKGCVAIGQGRFQALLLIEPVNPEDPELLAKIWPVVERANVPTVKHGRIAKDHIIFTESGKPLPRAGKGTIQRASANKLYAQEIEAFYSSMQDGNQRSSMKQLHREIVLDGYEQCKSSIAAYLCAELEITTLDDDEDFFTYGLDSLQLINLVRAINAVRAPSIDTKLIYDNATLDKLTTALLDGDTERYDFNNDSDDEELKESWLEMDEMYEEMTGNMQPVRLPAKPKRLHTTKRRRGRKSQTVKPVVQPDSGITAWSQVLAMFLVNLNNWGLVNSFGIFQAFYKDNYLSEYSESSIAWIGTIQGALLLIVGAVSGPLFDRGYFKTTLITGSIGLVFALMMLSLSKRYYEIMLSQGVLLGICEGLLYIPSIALVPAWFKKNRGLALGISTGGGSVGGVIYPIVFYRLLEEVGYAWAVRIIGFIALGTLTVAIMLSKPLSPRSPRQLIDLSGLRDPSFLVFLVSAFFLLAGMFVPFFLATSYSSHKLHADSSISFCTISILNAAQFVGRVLPAWTSDYKSSIGPEGWQLLGELCLGVLGFCWIAVHNLGGYIPWLVLFGFFSGFGNTLPAIVLSYICPSAAVYGTRIGVLYAVAGVGFLISTPIAGAANTATGGFLGSQIWTGTTCVAASLLFAFTALEARKRRLLYELGKRDKRQVKGKVAQSRDAEKRT